MDILDPRDQTAENFVPESPITGRHCGLAKDNFLKFLANGIFKHFGPQGPDGRNDRRSQNDNGEDLIHLLMGLRAPEARKALWVTLAASG